MKWILNFPVKLISSMTHLQIQTCPNCCKESWILRIEWVTPLTVNTYPENEINHYPENKTKKDKDDTKKIGKAVDWYSTNSKHAQ